MSFLKSTFYKLFIKKEVEESEILNSGLKFAMEFGETWLRPINEKLSKKYPQLTKTELNYYNGVCTSLRDLGHKFVYDVLEKIENDGKTIEEKLLKSQLSTFVLEKYSWVNRENINHLFSQSCYYAWREGLTKNMT